MVTASLNHEQRPHSSGNNEDAENDNRSIQTRLVSFSLSHFLYSDFVFLLLRQMSQKKNSHYFPLII